MERGHGFLSDPATNVTSSVDCIIVVAFVEGLQGAKAHFFRDVRETKGFDYLNQGLDGLSSGFGIVRLHAFWNTILVKNFKDLGVEELQNLW